LAKVCAQGGHCAREVARARRQETDPAAARRIAQERAGRTPVREAGLLEPPGAVKHSAIGRTRVVIASRRALKGTRLSTGYGEAIQGNVGRLRLLGRRVGALLAMTIPAD